MTVSIILAGKGREVVTIEPNATLAAAVALLAEKRIGALLILGAERRVVGILSERDIVRALAERGAAALDEPVSGAMTRKVSTASTSAKRSLPDHGAHDRGQIPPCPCRRPGPA